MNAVIYFRKALEYHITNVSETKLSNGEVSLFSNFFSQKRNSLLTYSYVWFYKLPNNFSVRLSTLYDSRKATRDWSGVLEDFSLCLLAFFYYCEANAKVCCKSAAIEQHLLVAWSRFKRDVHNCTTPSVERFLVIELCSTLLCYIK
jgi:hypothetical protein